jgi:hypothetical protein
MTHEQVPEEKTLITPVQCKNLWRQFKAETEYTVTQAIAAQVSPYDPFQQLLCTFCSVPAVAQSFLFWFIASEYFESKIQVSVYMIDVLSTYC